MSARGHYRVGVAVAPAVYVDRPPARAIYVEREPSTAAWILGALAAGGALLWARHQSRQVEQLYRKADLPYQGFASSLREGAASSLRSLAERARSKRKDT